MTRLRLSAIGLGLLLAGLILGLYVGWRLGARTVGWLGAASQDYVVAELAYTQYRQAGYQEAKESLEGHLAYLEQLLPRGETWAQGQSAFLSEGSLAADKTLTLARLALIEEREHGSGAGDAYWVNSNDDSALPLLHTFGTEVSFYHPDHLGSTSLISQPKAINPSKKNTLSNLELWNISGLLS